MTDEIKDFIVENPSKMTQELIKIINNLDIQMRKKLSSRAFISKLIIQFKINKYLSEGYKEFYYLLNKYEINYPFEDNIPEKRIKFLLDEFEKLYKKLLFNNFCLAYLYYKKGELKTGSILTKEDEKVIYFKKLDKREITPLEFKEKFGHYALNAYELSSRRFKEYSNKELMKLAKLTGDLKIKNKIELNKYLLLSSKDKRPILIALRELARYNILFVIQDLRKEILVLAKKNHIKKVFDKAFEDMV